MNIGIKAKSLAQLIRSGRVDAAWNGVRDQLYSNTLAYGLKRDLDKPFTAPHAKMPITVRPLTHKEARIFTDPSTPGFEAEKGNEGISRMRLFESGIGTCYAAVTEAGEICYVQWLIPPRDSERMLAHFEGVFPSLDKDVAMLEGMFTIAKFRRQGIMQSAMARIAEKAREHGCRYAITFVAKDNIASLKACKRAGFEPYCERFERRRLMHADIEFHQLPPGTPYGFEQNSVARS